MDKAKAERELLERYEPYVTEVLEPTKEELKELLRQWKKPVYWAKYQTQNRLPIPSPVQRIHSRVKRPESVIDKIHRKPDSYPDGLSAKSFYQMTDTCGVRVVVYFLSQMLLIDKEIRESDFFEISTLEPPVAYLNNELATRFMLDRIPRKKKESGYASIHYILRLKESVVPLEQRPWFELQLRTLCEDTWAEIEHILGYKPDKQTSFAVRRQFQLISDSLMVIDKHFNFLFEELSRFQSEIEIKNSDKLNAENLPPTLYEMGTQCAQSEIDGLLKLLASRGVKNVGHLRNLGSVDRLQLIRNVYIREEGRPPDTFEVVANLANLVGASDEKETIERIEAQITTTRVWYSIKGLVRGKKSSEESDSETKGEAA